MPDWAETCRALHHRGRSPRDAPHLRDRSRREHVNRSDARHPDDHPVAAFEGRDPLLHRGLPGLPILVTVFIVYLGLPSVSPKLEFGPLDAAAIALVFWGSAQVAEATRGAVQSIPREQHEAAAALGFGWLGSHRWVILPQALRRLLPPLVGLLVNIIQNSTLAPAIGGIELLQASKSQVERLTFFPPAGIGEIHAIEIFGFVMVLFFLISFPLTRLAAVLEKRLT